MEAQQINPNISEVPIATAHPLQVEFHWYLANRNELVKHYLGRYVVIAGQTILADYGTVGDAYRITTKTHKPGTFIIKRCIPVSEEQVLIIRNHDIVNFG